MDEFDRARLRSVLLLGGHGTAVDTADADPDVAGPADRHIHPDSYMGHPDSDSHAYGPHVQHADPVPGCHLCDAGSNAYAHGVPERGVDDDPGRHRVEGGCYGHSSFRWRTVERATSCDRHRDRNDNETVQVDGEVKK